MTNVCIYCGKMVDGYVCLICNEYDGVMPLDVAAVEYPEEFGWAVEAI